MIQIFIAVWRQSWHMKHWKIISWHPNIGLKSPVEASIILAGTITAIPALNSHSPMLADIIM